MLFDSLGLHRLLQQSIRDLRYAAPTPVQAATIPVIMAGRDVIATAQTGTGKTAAFLLPILHDFLSRPGGPTGAVVITPTRELAQQIGEVCLSLARRSPIRLGLLVGGMPVPPQERVLRTGVDIVVATPGRFLDHARRGAKQFADVHTLVLDEADQMLDMGFLPDVRRIVGLLPSRRQTLLFSATMPPVIQRLAGEILRNPTAVEIGRRRTPAIGITQAAYPVAEHLKTALLRYLLRHTEMPSVLVFTRTKQVAKRLKKVIEADGFTVAELHSNRSQAQRKKAMDGFRRGAFQVLVATNIAARGLDVDHITHVINVDVPNVPDDYVHRIGRTGRAEARGDAFVLVSPAEETLLAQIERQIGQRLPRVTLPDFDYGQAAPKPAGPPPHRRRRHPSNQERQVRRGHSESSRGKRRR
jgi:ATP-dependent RNA helicase RhlE